jgi:hypothetical protein
MNQALHGVSRQMGEGGHLTSTLLEGMHDFRIDRILLPDGIREVGRVETAGLWAVAAPDGAMTGSAALLPGREHDVGDPLFG